MHGFAMTFALLSACIVGGDADTGRTCAEINAEFEAEAASIRTCADDADCGQPLKGTSCGCTNDWVARAEADPSTFYALLEESWLQQCWPVSPTSCDCREPKGYQCLSNVCEWNFQTRADPYPACEADDGQATSIDSVVLDGDALSVIVSYSGGCSTHWFTTCWPDQSFLESAPVQAHLELLHEADAPDACEAWISEEVTVDLLPLRAAFEEGYGPNGTILVGLGDWSVEYSF